MPPADPANAPTTGQPAPGAEGAAFQPGQQGQPGQPGQPGQQGQPSNIPGMPSNESKPKMKKGMLIGILAGAVVLVVAVVAIAIVTLGGERFAEGGCARPDGDNGAVAISCDDAGKGDFKNTKQVDDASKCDDPTQASIEAEKDAEYYCVEPIEE